MPLGRIKLYVRQRRLAGGGQVLLALTIISTVAAVSGALSALGLLPQRRQDRPPTVVIVVTSIEDPAREPWVDHLSESDPKLESAA
jgi:hypothetical protein